MKAVKTFAIALVAGAVLIAGSTANVNGNVYGKPKAPVTIEVFSDFQCPACKFFHDGDFQRIMTDYVVPGKVYVVYRYFPLKGHPHGRECAEFACAASRLERYQKVSEALFANQAAIESGSMTAEQVVNSVLTPTEAKAVKALVKSPEVQRQIDTDLAEGTTVPVQSTPTLWVTARGTSQPINKFPLNYGLFKQYMDSLLSK
jgi:protein-disulfide isomerase